MNERQTLIAFCAILVAICYLGTLAGYLALRGKYAEALGFGGLTTGLVGVLGTFKPRTTRADEPQAVTVANTAHDPVPVESAR